MSLSLSACVCLSMHIVCVHLYVCVCVHVYVCVCVLCMYVCVCFLCLAKNATAMPIEN